MNKQASVKKSLFKSSGLIAILLISLFLLSACGQQQLTPPSDSDGSPLSGSTPTPTIAGTSVPTTPLRQVRFVDAHIGWGLSNSLVVYTRDGGTNWLSVTPHGLMDGGEDAVAAFQTNFRAWVFNPQRTSTTSGGLDITVGRTLDGGLHWTFAHINDPDAIGIADRPNFSDAEHGWVLLDTGAGAGSYGVKLYATTDGGVTWTLKAQAPGTIALGGTKAGPTFENNTRGWLANSVGALSDSPLLLKSTDGGQHWTKLTLPTVSGISDAFYQTTPPLFFGTTGAMPVHINAGGTKKLAIYGSTNDGDTWTVNNTATFDTENIYFVDLTHFWALEGTTLHATTNGGTSWSNVGTLPSTAGTMSFISTSEGWITDTGSGVLYHTTDGGHTWATITYHFYEL